MEKRVDKIETRIDKHGDAILNLSTHMEHLAKAMDEVATATKGIQQQQASQLHQADELKSLRKAIHDLRGEMQRMIGERIRMKHELEEDNRKLGDRKKEIADLELSFRGMSKDMASFSHHLELVGQSAQGIEALHKRMDCRKREITSLKKELEAVQVLIPQLVKTGKWVDKALLALLGIAAMIIFKGGI